MNARPTVQVLMGGPSGEREVSLSSGGAVVAALRLEGHPVVEVEVTRERGFRFDGGAPLELPAAAARLAAGDVIFPALHGPGGEDGTIQGFLEMLGVPYVGSGVCASALAMDKALSRRIARTLGIRVAEAVEAGAGESLERLIDRLAPLGFPLFVKPNGSGSSVGVSRVDAPAALAPALRTALAEGCGVLVEAAVAGTEVSCPVLGHAGEGAHALPVIEIVPKGHAFFDYTAKYTPGVSDEICPGRFPAPVARALQEAALLLHDTFGCRSLSRADFIVPADGPPIFLELNTLPGLTEVSLFPKAAAAAGLTYPELCARLVAGADWR